MHTHKGTPKESSDLRSHPIAMLLLLKKKRGKRHGMRRIYWLRTLRSSSGHVTLSLPAKRPHKGGDGATSDCACAEHTSGQYHFRSRDWCHFRSRHFRSCAMVRSTARSTANTNLSVPIYYWGVSGVIYVIVPCLCNEVWGMSGLIDVIVQCLFNEV